MREKGRGWRAVRGTIRRRLLVNAVVDPDEAAAHLPGPLQPHVIDGGTVVGCCLLDVDQVRPARLPAVVGTTLRAAAHRISVEWQDENSGVTTVGVFVPVRHTDCRAAALVGGRWVPGVHRRAAIRVSEAPGRLRWSVEDPGGASGCGIRVTASVPHEAESTPSEPVGDTCLGATVGVSPDHHGLLEGVEMIPERRQARQVAVGHLQSDLLAGFSTARPAPSYLMTDVEVAWRPARAPRLTIWAVA